jgi:hypothetical protein
MSAASQHILGRVPPFSEWNTERSAVPWSELSRMAGTATILGVAAYSFSLLLPTFPALLVGVPVGAVIYGALRSFAEEDGPRLRGLGAQLPSPYAFGTRAACDGC